MPADPGMRDHTIACEIASASGYVSRLHDTMVGLVEHATDNDAHLHAEQYDAIAVQLRAASKALESAHDRMLNFETEKPKDLVQFVYEMHIDALDDNGEERSEEDILAEARSRMEELIAQEGFQAAGSIVAGQRT